MKTAMASDDREDIERKTQALEQASTRAHAEDVRAVLGRRPGRGCSVPEARAAAEGGKQDDVLDAEFEEVKESDRKKA